MPKGSGAGSLKRLFASPVFWMVIGLLCVAFAGPVRDWVVNIYAASHPGEHPKFKIYADLVAYVVEHLGAVVFVAMLVRLAIEKKTQQEAVGAVSQAVKDQVAVAFGDVDEKIANFNRAIGTVNDSLKTIQVVTGGSLYGQKLTPEDRDQIAKTFLNPAFFRPYYKLTIYLAQRGSGLMGVNIKTYAGLQNISNHPQPLKIAAFLDNALFQHEGGSVSTASKFHRFEYGLDTSDGRDMASRRPLLVDHEGNAQFATEVGDRLVFDFDPKISIQPTETYFVKMFAEQQMRTSDLFIWTMQLPTEHLDFTVHLEGALTTENFTLIARPMHHGEHGDFQGTKISEQEHFWTIKNVVLPFQGIQLWWSPKPRAQDGTAAAPVAGGNAAPVVAPAQPAPGKATDIATK